MSDDLVRLIRADAAQDEPPFALDPRPLLRQGRRRLRARRGSLALRTAAAVTFVICLAGLPDPAEGHSPDLASSHALAGAAAPR